MNFLFLKILFVINKTTKMISPIKTLKIATRNALAAMPEYNMTADEMVFDDAETERFVTMKRDSCMLDLVQCLEFTSNKREKRLQRAEFLLRVLASSICQETKDRFTKVKDSFKGLKEESQEVAIQDDDQQLRALIECTAHNEDMSDGLIFEKFSSTKPFIVPIKQKFHDFCKTKLNSDGFVYDIFTNIAIISFKELTVGAMSEATSSKLRRALLSTATLIFKGGAAMGKFLFMADEELWNSLSEEDKEFVRTNFINGGDNDTSISFHTLPTDEWSCEEINQEIGSILYDMEGVVLNNVVKYSIEGIIKEYIEATVEGVMEFAGKKFSFSHREATSFAIVEKNETHVECLSLDRTKQALFGSISYLEFDNQNKEKVKFYLGRIKAAFTATLEDGTSNIKELSFNCYAECLDISACYIDSAEPFAAQYCRVDFSSFV